MQKQEKIKSITSHIVKKYTEKLYAKGIPVEKVILFGSRARGTEQKDSDVDLLVVVTSLNKEIREIIIDAAFDTSVEEDVDVIALPCSLAEYNSPLFQADHFYRNIQKEGVLFSWTHPI